MNKKVFISMLILTISFLVSFYVLKIFFPQEFMMSIQNEQLIKIGTFINSNEILFYICGGITAFITYWLFLCCCKRKLSLNWKESLVIIAFIVIIRLVSLYDLNISTHISISSFFIIPLIFKYDLKTATIVYTIHGFSQVLSLSIRNLTMYLASGNFITMTLLAFDMYLWLILCYVICNYKKEK